MSRVMEPSRHAWGPPVPGGGRAEVCKLCGERRTATTERAACDGSHSQQASDSWASVKHEYDPHND